MSESLAGQWVTICQVPGGAAAGRACQGQATRQATGGRQREAGNERQATGDTCLYCGTETTDESGPSRAEGDHAVPKSRGGDNNSGNINNSCQHCNRQKGPKTVEEYREWLKSKGYDPIF